MKFTKLTLTNRSSPTALHHAAAEGVDSLWDWQHYYKKPFKLESLSEAIIYF